MRPMPKGSFQPRLERNADVIEKAMNHAVRNQVRGVYNRAQYADERRKMLQEWADWLEGLKDG
jgi:hypothetical protein